MLFALRKAIQFSAEGRSGKWRTVRAHFLEGKSCAACGGTECLEAHHVRAFADHPEMELMETNLLALCESPARLCHFRIGHEFSWRAINPHSREDAAQSLERVKHRVERPRRLGEVNSVFDMNTPTLLVFMVVTRTWIWLCRMMRWLAGYPGT